MLVGDFFDHGQTQACAARLGGHIGLEGSLKNIGSKTCATVADAQAHTLGRVHPAGFDGDGSWSLPCFLGPLCRGILCILQKIVDDLPQLLAIALGAAPDSLGLDRLIVAPDGLKKVLSL